jgi:uncharacterized repeat protein (TIGR01451 family)
MKKSNNKLALAAATGAVLFLSGVTAGNAADLRLMAEQPTVAGEISTDSDGLYIVRLAEPAVATYDGGISGFKATSAKATGKKRLDIKSSESQKYKKHLQKQQSKVLDNAGKSFGRKLDTKHTYQYAVNGFAVTLTTAEAKALRSMDGVVSVEREKMERLLTDVGPQWISAPEVWNNKPAGTKGEGVVVAILDSGINSDHPSFADVGGDGYDHTNPLGSGTYIPGSYCESNPGFCNDKLIGAWDFDSTDGPIPEDDDGHGSHTASTVAGNVVYGAELIAPTTAASFDISGVAPHANIIAYDVCHLTPSGGTCPSAALVAAIEQVVIDSSALPNGIAALNYSISGGGNPYNDTVELGFLAAVDAGIYVAASAGNSGPAASSVAHLGPWVSTTAASTHNRSIVNNLVDMDSSGGPLADIKGASLSVGYGPAPIIHANTTAFDPAGQCLNPFPPGTFSGEIVVCDRGTIARTAKGENVLAGGAGGYVLANLPSNGESTSADAHYLPAIHVGATDGDVLRAWLAANTDTVATITPFGFDLDPANGDVMAGFSSRGPQLVFDVNKPDITAPGVNVMGANADAFGQYQIISGTSMSSPHNAGSGALMTALRPDLNPVEIKSAIMLSSSNEFMVKEDGVTPADAFDHGAGRIDLGAAKEAGLVMDISTQEFLDANPDEGGDPSTLNLASMMSSNCVGTCTWTRTVTNSTKNTAHWNVTASGNGFGVEVSVDPQSNSDDYNLKLKKGESATITVTANTLGLDEDWYFGEVHLDRNLDKGPDLHMPISVFAARASNPTLFSKSVDAETASAGDTLTYELSVANGTLAGPITVTDVLPEGTTFVPASETESVVNGSTTSAWSYDAESNSLSWTGELDTGGLEITPDPGGSPGGYLPLALFGIAPLNTGCNGNCDDGGYFYNVAPYTYNGETYTQTLFSVNGTLEAGSASLSFSSFNNQNLPDSTSPNNILAPFWRDLDQSAGGEMYLGRLGGGCAIWTIYEWAAVPHWGGSDTVSMQVWIGENGTCVEGDIHFTYGDMDNPAAGGTIGVENASGTVGTSYYFNGTGVAPAADDELRISSTIGGTANLGFQVVTDCSADVIANQGDLSNAGGDETAIAVTQCE